jgi:hypothetical protein
MRARDHRNVGATPPFSDGDDEETNMRNYEADILNQFLGAFFAGCAALSVIAAIFAVFMAISGY